VTVMKIVIRFAKRKCFAIHLQVLLITKQFVLEKT